MFCCLFSFFHFSFLSHVFACMMIFCEIFVVQFLVIFSDLIHLYNQKEIEDLHRISKEGDLISTQKSSHDCTAMT